MKMRGIWKALKGNLKNKTGKVRAGGIITEDGTERKAVIYMERIAPMINGRLIKRQKDE